MIKKNERERIEKVREIFATLTTENLALPEADAIRAAFAATPRERFLGKGPWRILTSSGFEETPSDDPALVYCDAPIAIDPQKGINNGQPTLYARCLGALNIQPGETIIHVGTGTGYYTAILARLTGPGGRVRAFEIDARLAERAAASLGDLDQVRVYKQSGCEGPLPESDVIYVSAGATAPQTVWLKAMRPGGRLLFPLTDATGVGGELMITRTLKGSFGACFVCSAAFISCTDARDDETGKRLSQVFAQRNLNRVRSLRLTSEPDEMCWFEGRGWWLSTVAPE